jgi:hypothetical protein
MPAYRQDAIAVQIALHLTSALSAEIFPQDE